MKYFKTPNNDPFLAAICFMLMILIAVLLFLAAVQYLPRSADPAEFSTGTGNGSGSGSGDGSGRGGGTGEVSGTGESGSGTGDSTGAEPGKVQNKGDDTGTGKKDEPEKKDEKDPQGKADSGKAGTNKDTGENHQRPKGEEIFLNSGKDDDNDQRRSRRGGPANSGKRSFSSGGKSVFNVKRHENVLFIVDISPSMDYHTRERISKIEILKIHLKAVLGIMLDTRSIGKYAILAFSSGTISFPDNGQQFAFNSKSDFDKAVAWIDNINKLPRSGTPLYGAMAKAAELMTQRKFKVDAIYLLTDGEPNDIRDQKIYIALMRKRYPKRVKVHTIAIGRHSDLLKVIAKQGRGKYERFE